MFMEKVFMDYDKINNLELIGRGFEGRVFKLNENTAIKIFSCSNVIIPEFKFSNLNLKYIVVPKEKIYIGNILKGYTMDYIKGIPLNKANISHNYDLLINICREIKKEIQLVSNNQIIFNDLNEKNIIYNGYFYLIDCLDKRNLNISKEECYKNNLKEFYKIIFYKLLNEDKFLMNKILKSNELKPLYMNSISYTDLPYFLQKIKTRIN